jgi:hypothetical protein
MTIVLTKDRLEMVIEALDHLIDANETMGWEKETKAAKRLKANFENERDIYCGEKFKPKQEPREWQCDFCEEDAVMLVNSVAMCQRCGDEDRDQELPLEGDNWTNPQGSGWRGD